MSSTTGFFKNLNISQDLTLADQIRLSGFANGEKYRIIFPATQPSGGLSVLGVSGVSFDEIFLEWLTPSESLPFDVINCNQLNAYGKEGVAITADDDVNITNGNLLIANGNLDVSNGSTSLGYMEAQIVNARKSGGTETSGFLVSPSQVENNIGYFLPAERPISNGQVLASQTDGTMSWVGLSFPSAPAYRKNIIDIDTLLTAASPEHVIPYNPFFSLIIGTTYKLTTTFSFRKEAGTTFSLFCSVLPLTGGTIITEGMATNTCAIVNVSNTPPNNPQNFQHTYWFIATDTTTTWEVKARSGAQAGGECRWDLVDMVFEPTIPLTADVPPGPP
jgi:hypothetical protein